MASPYLRKCFILSAVSAQVFALLFPWSDHLKSDEMSVFRCLDEAHRSAQLGPDAPELSAVLTDYRARTLRLFAPVPPVCSLSVRLR